jgi:hypothetical protein
MKFSGMRGTEKITTLSGMGIYIDPTLCNIDDIPECVDVK